MILNVKRFCCFYQSFLLLYEPVQRYYWFKKKNPIWNVDRPFPMDVEYMVWDTLEALRPKLKICQNWEEASQAADELDKEFRAKIGLANQKFS